MNLISILGLFFLVFMLLSSISPRRLLSNKPVIRQNYSLFATNTFTERMETSILKTPFYVRASVIDVTEAFSISKETEEKVDTEFLVKIRLNCANSLQLKMKLERLAQESKGNARRLYRSKAEEVSEAACLRISHIKKRFPDYLKNLQF